MKVSTSGYNPTGNVTVERFHRYLNASLCILFNRKEANWDDYIPPVLFSYRVAVNESTGFSPFKLETGRDPILPAHMMFPFLHEDRTDEETCEDSREHEVRIRTSSNAARGNVRKEQGKNGTEPIRP